MKKLLKAMIACTIVLLSLAGCSKQNNNTPAAPKTLLEQIRERGYITVGTEGTYFPNSYHD